jgi:hypothetical protein
MVYQQSNSLRKAFFSRDVFSIIFSMFACRQPYQKGKKEKASGKIKHTIKNSTRKINMENSRQEKNIDREARGRESIEQVISTFVGQYVALMVWMETLLRTCSSGP